MRLFIAIDFDNYTKNKILEIQNRLRKQCTKGRWKHSDNFHLTLKFLGEVEEDRIPELNNALATAAQNGKSFFIRLNNLGCFDNTEITRVVWIGLEGQLDKLNTLYNSIEQELEKIGFEREKRGYSPHVTIGQDVLFNTDFNNIMQIYKVQFEQIKVNKIVLMKSEQIGAKRVYTPLYEYNLM